MENFKKSAFWPLMALVVVLFIGFTFSSVNLVNLAEAQPEPQERIPSPLVYDVSKPGKNCDQYYKKAIEEANEKAYTVQTVTMLSMMYSFIYQNCLARENRR